MLTILHTRAGSFDGVEEQGFAGNSRAQMRGSRLKGRRFSRVRDPLKPDWYKPTKWFVMGKELHASRLLTLVGSGSTSPSLGGWRGGEAQEALHRTGESIMALSPIRALLPREAGGTPSGPFKRATRRVAALHGLSHRERDLLTESFGHMRHRGPGLFVSIEAGRSPDAEKIVRAMTRRVRSDLAQRQRRAGMRRARLTTVFEALGRDKQPKFGAHIVAVMPNAAARDRAIEGLNGSSAYARMATGFIESGRPVFAEPVTDWAGLMGYLLKEATPQAQYQKGFRRVGGSIPLGVAVGIGLSFRAT